MEKNGSMIMCQCKSPWAMNIGVFVYLFIPMKYVILVGRKKFSGDPSIEAIPQETDPDSVSNSLPILL